MRIPRSVIVMTLLTAVPFGLAIRAAVKEKSHDKWADDDDSDSLAKYDREEASYKELRAEQERQHAAEDQRKRVSRQVLGEEPASLGTLLEGVQLGAPAGSFQPESVRTALRDASEAVSVDWDVDAARLNGLTVHIKGDDYGCSLRDAASIWGGDGEHWQNPSTHQRAELDVDACTMHFERYADPEQWLDKGDASIVPFSAVGQPAAKLHNRVLDKMDDGSDGEDEFGWHDLGLAGRMGRTTLFANTKAGKVIAVSATFGGDAATFDALVARITKLTGVKPTRTLESEHYDDGAPTMSWKSKPPVELHDGDVRVLTIGTIPEPQ